MSLEAFAVLFAITQAVPDVPPDSPRILFEPSGPAFAGDETRIRVQGLEPHAVMELRAEIHDRLGRGWSSRLRYRANAEGVIDVQNQASEGRSAVEPLRLYADLQRRPEGPTIPNHHTPHASVLEISVWQDDEVIARAHQLRRISDPDVTVREVLEGTLVAELFVPPDADMRPAVIVVSDANGGLRGQRNVAALLSARGFVVLALAFFGMEGLPAELDRVPLEICTEAVDWLIEQPEVDPERIAMMGGSKGGELSLLVASRDARLRAVVALVPSSHVWEGISQSPDRGSSWTANERSLPYVPYVITERYRQDPQVHILYEESLAHASHDTLAASAIPVESILAPLFLLSGADDRIWPSDDMCERICARRKGTDAAARDVHLHFPEAGHEIGEPGYAPVRYRDSMGGTALGHARARAEAWPALVAFLRRELGTPNPDQR